MKVWELADVITIGGKIEIVEVDDAGGIVSENVYDSIDKTERWIGKKKVVSMWATDDRIVFVVNFVEYD